MSQLLAEVNNISARVRLFLESEKIRVVSATTFQKGKKLLESKEVATDYCNLHKDPAQYADAFKFLVQYCAQEYIKQQELAQHSSESIPDYGFYGVKRARMRSKQLYFCDNPASPGFILDPRDDGDYNVSDDMHSLHIFRRDLGCLGEEAYAEWTQKNLIVGAYRYEPWGPTLAENSSFVYTLNTYKKPSWHDKIKKRTWEELPAVLRCFYQHLFPDPWQRNYALNWLACTVQGTRLKRDKPKLSTYLALIGASGVGKGIFLEKHGAFLHGYKNFVTETKQHIGEKFAMSAYYDKTLLVFNETEISTREDYNALKSFESVYLNVELKQQTPKMRKTFFNVAWSMNPTNGLKYVDPDDRRFSIPDINKNPIKGITMKDDVTGQEVLFDDDALDYLSNNEELLITMAEYFLGLEPDFKLAETPLKETARYKEVMTASRPAWIQELLESFKDIDWSNSGGSQEQLGWGEIRPSSDKQRYYTYQIDADKVMRMVRYNTSTRRTMLPTKSRVQEELKRVPASECHSYLTNGYWSGVRIRHPDHDKILDLMNEGQRKMIYTD